MPIQGNSLLKEGRFNRALHVTSYFNAMGKKGWILMQRKWQKHSRIIEKKEAILPQYDHHRKDYVTQCDTYAIGDVLTACT